MYDEQVFGIFDKVGGVFVGPIWTARNRGVATRQFQDMVNSEPAFRDHADDYELRYLGNFDRKSGFLVGVEVVESLGAASEYVRGPILEA